MCRRSEDFEEAFCSRWVCLKMDDWPPKMSILIGNMDFRAPYFQTNLDNPGYWSMKTPDMPWLQDTTYLHMLGHEPTTKQFLHVGSFPTSDAKPASAQIMALRADFGCVLLRASWSALSHGVKTPAVKPCIVYIIDLPDSVGSKVPGAERFVGSPH